MSTLSSYSQFSPATGRLETPYERQAREAAEASASIRWAMACSTVFQGLTVSPGDLYETEGEAMDELADYHATREAEGLDEDDSMLVIPVTLHADGSLTDAFGFPVTRIGG